MITLGITGGIGCGKTTICKALRLLDIPIFISDIEAKKLMTFDPIVKNKLTSILGIEAYQEDGNLNKPYISNKIFHNQEILRKVNKVVHHATKESFKHWKQLQKNSIIAYESALLFESGSDKLMDKVIFIQAPLKTRIERVMKRDKISKEQVQARINNQMDEKKKEKRADYIINNHNQLIIPQLLKLIDTI
ncbi:dephospho-CoA kinase [Halosquirtibacter laminarini]|uniref:Dephospho-CoA kinase n=1 Tax=Halosquirtibacter laminarini TaxID=3374600 RepID=A0AC61NL00_9BACT|nr:dephospho-CoA kinase [Prolixibacteraceae bacterium]